MGSFEQSSRAVPSNIVSDIDAPIHVFANRSGLISGPPLLETRSTRAMSFTTEEDCLTITDSNRLTTVPFLFRAVILRKHIPVVSSLLANEGEPPPMIEHATIDRRNLRIPADYRRS